MQLLAAGVMRVVQVLCCCLTKRQWHFVGTCQADGGAAAYLQVWLKTHKHVM